MDNNNNKYMLADVTARFNALFMGHNNIKESLDWFIEEHPSYLYFGTKEFINDLKDLREQYADELSRIDSLLEHINKDYNNFN